MGSLEVFDAVDRGT